MRTTAYLKAIMEVYGKTITGLGSKEEKQAFLLDNLAAMHVTCVMFLVHCIGFSESYNDFSFEESILLKNKIIDTADK